MYENKPSSIGLKVASIVCHLSYITCIAWLSSYVYRPIGS